MRNSENYLPKTGPAKTGPAGPLAMAAVVGQGDRSMFSFVGTVNSPTLTCRNQKNLKQQAAQSIFMSTLSTLGDKYWGRHRA